MSLRFASGKIIHTASDRDFVQLFEFNNTHSLGTKTYILLSATGSKDSADELCSIVNNTFTQHSEDWLNTPKKLKEKVNYILQKIISEKTQIGVISLTEDKVYFAGNMTFMALRDGLIAKTTPSATPAAISGSISKGDVFLVATKSFFDHVSGGAIKAGLAIGKPDLICEFFTPSIRRSTDSGGVLILSEFEDNSVNQTPPETKPLLPVHLKHPDGKTPFEDPGGKHSKRAPLVVGIVLLLLLILSIVLGMRKKTTYEHNQLFESRILEIESLLKQSLDLELTNPEKSRELFIQAKEKVNILQSEGAEDKRLIQFVSSVLENEGKILKEYNPSSQTFVDLALLANNFSADSLVVSGENMFVLDKHEKRIVRISIANKNTRIIVGPDSLTDPQNIAVHANRILVVEKDGIYEIKDSGVRLLEINNNLPLAVYAGNLYLLRDSPGEIVRYPLGTGITEGKSWLKGNTEYDFSSARQIVIDGSIWIVTKDSRILKFASGQRVNYKINPPFEVNVDWIYTDENLESMYVLDKDNSTVLVFTKEGDFVAHYKTESVKEGIQIAVSEKEKRIILMTKDKLLEIPLSHI
jgi:hypothetical protein